MAADEVAGIPEDERGEIEALRAQNQELHEQVKRLIATERALLESDISHSYRVKHIRLVNEFALASAQVDEILPVYDLSLKMLFAAFSFDVIACYHCGGRNAVPKLGYRIRSSKKFANYPIPADLQIDETSPLLQTTQIFEREKVATSETAYFTAICRKILEDEEEDEGFDKAHKVLVTLPLRRRNGTLIGLIFGLSAAPDLEFAAELTRGQVPRASDLAFISLCTSHIEAAIEKLILIQESHARGMEQAEMEATKSIQERLLPLQSMPPPGIEMAYHYRPAATAGGDWFGYCYDRSNHALNIYIGDVTGHGVSSSIITGVACGAIYGAEAVSGHHDRESNVHSCVEDRMRRLVSSINSVLFHTGRPNKLMTMAFLSLQLDTGELTYINCGHPPIYVLGNGRKMRALIFPSAHLGQHLSYALQVKKMQLNPGDSLFAFTDGLIENEGADGNALGEKKLRSLLTEDTNPTELCSRVLAAADEIWHGASLADDVTLAIFRWLGSVSREEFSAKLNSADMQTLWGIQNAGKASQ
jgi:serine phosphatase RsbU (regulator of sigma subunit)